MMISFIVLNTNCYLSELLLKYLAWVNKQMDMTNFAKDQIEKIVEVFLKKNKKQNEIKELKELPSEDQGLYSLQTTDGEKYVICIYDIDLNTQKAIYWMDRYTYYGDIQEVFNDQHITLIIYSRGEKYQNEYLIKH